MSVLKRYTGTEWEIVGGGGPGDGATIYQDNSAPVGAVEDDLWIDTNESAEVGLSSIIGYAEVTANQASIATEVDLTGLSVNVVVPAGRRLRITGFVGTWASTAANDRVIFAIKEGATQLNRLVTAEGDTTIGNQSAGGVVQVIVSPSAGSHTYRLTAAQADAGTITMFAAATQPAYILVEDITGTLWPAGQSIGVGAIASEAWAFYTPIWTASGTQPVIGNGAITGRYTKIGRTVIGVITVLFGSTTTFGTGVYYWSPPVAFSPSWPAWGLVGVYKAYNGGSNINAILRHNNAGAFQASYSATWPAGAETHVSQTLPWTWVNGNNMDMTFTYEAAV